jgi:hypothetical protein
LIVVFWRFIQKCYALIWNRWFKLCKQTWFLQMLCCNFVVCLPSLL